ncbi:hypothetical protein JL722_12050 [Aureococcus anophagefferens]|nr:hypothetical protein JL722_12050 [Aureococcus anophagefferens]
MATLLVALAIPAAEAFYGPQCRLRSESGCSGSQRYFDPTASAVTFWPAAWTGGASDAPNAALTAGDLVGGDGLADVLVGGYDGGVVLFVNAGSGDAPDFVETPWDYGAVNASSSASPWLADIFDDDGLLDLVVGERLSGTVRLYRNGGTAARPDFSGGPTLTVEASKSCCYLQPTTGDLDHDGDLDLLVGTSGGELVYLENVGDASAPDFFEGDNPFADITLAQPRLVDLDGDATLDLVGQASSSDNVPSVYTNVGSVYAARFALDDALLGGFDGSGFGALQALFVDVFADDGFDDLIVFDTDLRDVLAAYETSRTAAAAAVDVDGDGDADLVVASPDGRCGLALYDSRGPGVFEAAETLGSPLEVVDAALQAFASSASDVAVVAFTSNLVDGFDHALAYCDGWHWFSRASGAEPRGVYAADDEALFRVANTEASFAVDTDLVLDTGGSPCVTYACSPQLGDGDGDLDLVVGCNSVLYHYENVGDATTMSLAAATSGALDLVSVSTASRPRPLLADLDGDADLDLLLATTDGSVAYYEAGYCVPSGPCGSQGLCDEDAPSPQCDCLIGFAGPQCFECQEGYFSTTCELCPEGGDEDRSKPRITDTCGVKNSGRSRGSCAAGRAAAAGDVECGACAAGRYSEDAAAACGECDAGSFSLTSATECVACAAGYISDAGAESCAQCDAGRYANGGASCDACPAGSFSQGGATECVDCPDGSISAEGSGACSQCDVGTYADAATQSCLDCPAGTYSLTGAASCVACGAGLVSFAGAPVCTQCGSGRYVFDAGSCADCPAGSFSLNGATECVDCPEGSVSAAASGACTQCDAGTYADAATQSCLDCAAGTYSLTGAASCVACGAGSVSSAAPVCTQCEAGRYATADASACADCPAGLRGPRRGILLRLRRGHAVERVGGDGGDCPAGTYSPASSSFCVACPENSASAPGSATCASCDVGEVPTAGNGTCVACPPGAYAQLGDAVCAPCAAGRFGASPGLGACSFCAAGSYAAAGATACGTCDAGSASGPNAERCDLRRRRGGDEACGACPAGTFSLAASSTCDQCAAGRAAAAGSAACDLCPAGAFSTAGAGACMPCEADTFASSNGSGWAGYYESGAARACERCGGGEIVLYVLPTICVLFFIAIVFSLKAAKVDTRGAPRPDEFRGTSSRAVSADNVGKAIEDVRDKRAPKPAAATQSRRSKRRLSATNKDKVDDAKARDRYWRARLTTTLKQLSTLFAVLTALPWTLELDFPASFNALLDATDWANLDLVRLVPLACVADVSFVRELLLTCNFPLGVICALWLGYFAFVRGNKALPLEKRLRIRALVTQIALVGSYLVYPAVSSKVFRALRPCLELDEKYGGSRTWFRDDFSLPCDSSSRGTAFQCVVGWAIATLSIKIIATTRPFVDDADDALTEAAMWSIMLVFFGALLIRVDVEGDSDAMRDAMGATPGRPSSSARAASN